MVNVDKTILEEKLKEISEEPDLKRAKRFVENFFYTLGNQSLEEAYLNYLMDLQLYSPTNKAIRENSTYLCFLFKEITHSSIEELVKIESKYKEPPTVIPFNPSMLEEILSKNDDEEFGDLIYKYTADDAVEDSLFVKVGKLGFFPIYITNNLYNEGYEDKNKLNELLKEGFELLSKPNKEDTDYLHLRVVEKDKIWVALNGEGIIFMKPEDY